MLLLRPRQPAARVISTLAFALAVLMGGIETLMVLGLARTTVAKCLLLFSQEGRSTK